MGTVLEFYCGIGGLRFAYEMALDALPPTHPLKGATHVVSFDINTTTAQIYEATFHESVQRTNLEFVKPEQIDRYGASVWLLSPPCQPYNSCVNSKKLDLADKRSASLAHLMLDVLPQLHTKPAYLLLENVKGFRDSELRARVLAVLAAHGYAVRELLLSPTQFGMPNQRTRYLLLATRAPRAFTTEPDAHPALPHGTRVPPCTAPACRACHLGPTVDAYLEHGIDDTPFLVRDTVVASHDIVTPESTEHTCCFTKGYGKLVEGAGSVLQTRAHTLPARTLTGADLVPCRLRYFTPREVARLHGFPARLVLPATMTPRQLYRVLGNSLNCVVLSHALQYLFGSGGVPAESCAASSASDRTAT